MEENKIEKKLNNSQQIAGAIIIAGVIIGGAILMKGNTGNSVPRVVSAAKIAGLNIKAFDACVASGKFREKVQADIDDGTQAGVNGTPSSFILKNGIVVATIGGAQTFETVTQQIKDALENEKKPLGTKIKPISPSDHILGSINAKIIILEYSDIDCPFCKVFHNTMHRIVKENEGNVGWVYRHYPIAQLHPNAFAKAEETECAFEQKGNDGFWKYIDILFGVGK